MADWPLVPVVVPCAPWACERDGRELAMPEVPVLVPDCVPVPLVALDPLVPVDDPLVAVCEPLPLPEVPLWLVRAWCRRGVLDEEFVEDAVCDDAPCELPLRTLSTMRSMSSSVSATPLVPLIAVPLVAVWPLP